MDNIFILDKEKIKRDILSNNGSNPISPFYNDIHTIYLTTGAETFEFDTFGAAAINGYLVLGNYVMFKDNDKYKMFQIVTMDTTHGEDMVKNCYCETVGLELRNHVVRAMNIDGDVNNFFNTILINSPFKLGYVEKGINEVKSVKIDKPIGAYQLIQDNLSTFNIEVEFAVEYVNNSVVGQVINVYRQRGKETNIRFEYGENVDNIKKSEDLSEFCTALVGVGSNGCDFKNNEWTVANGNPVGKPLNQDFIADMEAFNFKNNNGSHIMGIFEGTSENGADLLLETWNELQRIKQPKIDYEFNIELLETENIAIGDTVYCIDNDYNPPLHLSARVSELQLCYTDPTKNKCILSNYKEVKSKIKQISKDDILKDIIDYINSLEVGILTEAQINTLKSYMSQLSLENEEINLIIEKLKQTAYDKFSEQEREKVYGENVDITLNEGRNYYCQDIVSSIKINAPTTNNNTTYTTTLTFKTRSDEVTKVNQDNAIWLKGDDCINGGLLVKGDTSYSIVFTYNLDTSIPRSFVGQVTAISRGEGQYITYSNKTPYITDIVNVMTSYYNNRDVFVYSTRTPYSFKNPNTTDSITKWTTDPTGLHIDCSTFIGMTLRGISYENSIYVNNTLNPRLVANNYSWAWEMPRFAAEQAKYCVEQGWQLSVSVTDMTTWQNLLPGDLVFWAKRSEDAESLATVEDRFMQVGHVAIVKDKKEVEINGITYIMPHTYEVTTGTTCILNRLLSNNTPDKLLFFARPRK